MEGHRPETKGGGGRRGADAFRFLPPPVTPLPPVRFVSAAAAQVPFLVRHAHRLVRQLGYAPHLPRHDWPPRRAPSVFFRRPAISLSGDKAVPSLARNRRTRRRFARNQHQLLSFFFFCEDASVHGSADRNKTLDGAVEGEKTEIGESRAQSFLIDPELDSKTAR